MSAEPKSSAQILVTDRLGDILTVCIYIYIYVRVHIIYYMTVDISICDEPSKDTRRRKGPVLRCFDNLVKDAFYNKRTHVVQNQQCWAGIQQSCNLDIGSPLEYATDDIEQQAGKHKGAGGVYSIGM